jgi:hypothetical protein
MPLVLAADVCNGPAKRHIRTMRNRTCSPFEKVMYTPTVSVALAAVAT